MDRYKNFLLIFGGSGAYNRTSKMRIWNKELHIFNLSTHTWMKELKIKNKSSFKPSPRMYHGSAIFDNYLLIHGGINTNNKRSYPIPNSEECSSKLTKNSALFRFKK